MTEVKATTEPQSETTAVALFSRNSAIGDCLSIVFDGVDFSGLNNAIEKIAEHSGDLDASARESAVNIVSEWENGVISKLDQHNSKLSEFVDCFAAKRRFGSLYHLSLPDEVLTDLAAATGTVTELTAYLTARTALQEHDVTTPEDPSKDIQDPDQTYAEKAEAEQNYNRDLTKHRLEGQRHQRTCNQAELAWKEALSQNSNFIAFVSKVTSYKRGMGKLTSQCQEKSQMARLNITIASPEIRKSLKDLINFSAKI
jgi:hypothetical protein